MLGVWERIMIGVYLVWVAVLAIVLLRVEKRSGFLSSSTGATLKDKVTGYEQRSKMKQTI